ncbi:MAG: M91 family zinc metallopeptidase [Pyrinomonadaceae bacterium]
MAFGEQFHILLRTYGDPWAAPTNMSQWTASVEDLLRKISSSDAGKALLNAIHDTGFFIKIHPESDTHCNAHGFGGGLEIDEQKRSIKGHVVFNPVAYSEGSHCFQIKKSKQHKNGGLPDEILFHEMIHAIRGGLRLNDARPVAGGLKRYSNTEEFLAILITNIYISDASNGKGSGLRAGHAGKSPLEAQFSRSLSFFASSAKILPLLKEFKDKQPKFFADLAKVKSVFNPFKAMTDDMKAVEKISNAKSTIAYDARAEKLHDKQIEAYKSELRESYKARNAQDAKQFETMMRSIAGMNPQELSRQMGALGREALEFLGL